MTKTTMPTAEQFAKMSEAQKLELIQNMNAERDAAVKAAERTVHLKVSEKGAVSLIGMGRFPVTLYAQQWVKVLAQSEAILKFIEANKANLSFK